MEGLGDGFASFGTILAYRFQTLLQCDVCLPNTLRWGISTQIMFGTNSAILLFDRPNERINVWMEVPNNVVEPVLLPFALVVCAWFVVKGRVVNVPDNRRITRRNSLHAITSELYTSAFRNLPIT